MSAIEKQIVLFEKLFKDIEYLNRNMLEENKVEILDSNHINLNLESLICKLNEMKEEMKKMIIVKPEIGAQLHILEELISSLMYTREKIEQELISFNETKVQEKVEQDPVLSLLEKVKEPEKELKGYMIEKELIKALEKHGKKIPRKRGGVSALVNCLLRDGLIENGMLE